MPWYSKMEDYRRNEKCVVCGSKNIRPKDGYYETAGLISCKNCGLVFMERIPSQHELREYYSKYSYKSDGYLSPATICSYQKLLDEFENYRKRNRILDVGCGRGWFMIEAKKRGWDVRGVEYSSEAVIVCRKKGLNVAEGALSEQVFEGLEFDIVTAFEVIEHLNNPNKEIASIFNLVRPGGVFYCTTPNFDSALRYHFRAKYDVIGYPEHLAYYTKTTLNKVAKLNGFRPVKFLSTGISLNQFKTMSNELKPSNKDELLRIQISKKWYLGLIKILANWFLTLTNKGVTLKGYFEKPA